MLDVDENVTPPFLDLFSLVSTLLDTLSTLFAYFLVDDVPLFSGNDTARTDLCYVLPSPGSNANSSFAQTSLADSLASNVEMLNTDDRRLE